jgi:hypothetical protein
MQIDDLFQHVFAESLAIGKTIAFAENAAGDATAQVLDKIAVELGIDLADFAISVNLNDGSLARSAAKLRRESKGSIFVMESSLAGSAFISLNRLWRIVKCGRAARDDPVHLWRSLETDSILETLH